jgi:hypothetical protein
MLHLAYPAVPGNTKLDCYERYTDLDTAPYKGCLFTISMRVRKSPMPRANGGCAVLAYQGATLAANVPESKSTFQHLSQDGVYQLGRLEGISDMRMFVS